jgi:MerR family transcriptional regulator, copper efflux regulator
MRIGELARKAEVNIQTVRFYERLKILPAPPRTAAGYRSYAERDLENVRFIKRSQELGFTLAEIRQLLRLHSAVAALPAASQQGAGRRRPAELRNIAELARVRLQHIEQKLGLLRGMRMQLLSMIEELESASYLRCPAGPKASAAGSKASRRPGLSV